MKNKNKKNNKLTFKNDKNKIKKKITAKFKKIRRKTT